MLTFKQEKIPRNWACRHILNACFWNITKELTQFIQKKNMFTFFKSRFFFRKKYQVKETDATETAGQQINWNSDKKEIVLSISSKRLFCHLLWNWINKWDWNIYSFVIISFYSSFFIAFSFVSFLLSPALWNSFIPLYLSYCLHSPSPQSFNSF